MSSYSVFICDDDPIFASWLARQAEEVLPSTYKVSVFTSAQELTNAVFTQPPDICLLDIKLGEMSGIDLAKAIFPADLGTQVIYITGYAEYCTDVYESEHIYFLLKPVKPDELQRALSKAAKQLSQRTVWLAFQKVGGTYRLPLSEIQYIESRSHRLYVHTQNHTYEMMGKVSALPHDVYDRMIHCHKSFLVNPDHVKAIIAPPGNQSKQFLLFSGESIPISRSRWKMSQQRFMALIADSMIGDM